MRDFTTIKESNVTSPSFIGELRCFEGITEAGGEHDQCTARSHGIVAVVMDGSVRVRRAIWRVRQR